MYPFKSPVPLIDDSESISYYSDSTAAATLRVCVCERRGGDEEEKDIRGLTRADGRLRENNDPGSDRVIDTSASSRFTRYQRHRPG